MFDVSWSELLILGLVTLIFVGPKELPRFLGTLGRYAGVVRRQANEFRAVFEQAMREAELDQIQKEVRAVGDGVKASLDEATRSIESAVAVAKVEPNIVEPSVVEPNVKPEAEPKALPAEAPPPPSSDAPEAAEPQPDEPIKPDSEPTIPKSTVGPV